jgi:hypothetical protein
MILFKRLQLKMKVVRLALQTSIKTLKKEERDICILKLVKVR